MSRKKRYIENLSEEEQISLTEGYKRGKSPFFRRKFHCILLSGSGYSINDLSALFSVSIQSIYAWFNLWETGGIQALELKPGRGRKPKLDLSDQEQLRAVKALLGNDPQKLSQVDAKPGVKLSEKTLTHFLKRLD